MSEEIFYWDCALAGRYVTKRYETSVAHAVAAKSLRIGRLVRRRKQTFCNKVAPEHMSTGGVVGVVKYCERCAELVKKLCGELKGSGGSK